MSEEKQLGLWPNAEPKDSICASGPSEVKGTKVPFGLSIRTNRTAFISVSQAAKQLPPVEARTIRGWVQKRQEAEQRGNLSVEEFRLAKEAEEFVREKQQERFLETNGFPREWHEYKLHRIAYRDRYDSSHLEHYAKLTPHCLRLGTRGFPPPRNRGDRAAIQRYSYKSRLRFLEELYAVNWDKIPTDRIFEVTFTYPGKYPTDGREIKRHLDKLTKRLTRRFSDRGGMAFAWKLEFQRRGAPHFHLLLVAGDVWKKTELRDWFSQNWAEIVREWLVLHSGESLGTSDVEYSKHLSAGIELSGVRKNKMGMITYMAMYIGKGYGKAKEYQHEVPPEFHQVGRWWGFRGDSERLIPKEVEAMLLTREQFDLAYANGLRYIKATGARPTTKHWNSLKVFSRDGHSLRGLVDDVTGTSDKDQATSDQSGFEKCSGDK